MISNEEKIIRIFYRNPNDEFGLREMSRLTNLGLPSLKNYLKKFHKEDMIIIKRHKSTGYPIYMANYNDENFQLLKKLSNILCLHSCGLIKKVKESFPSSIVLFGSFARGQDTAQSDIDIFIESKELNIDFSSFEKILERKIHPFYQKNFGKLSKELKNNILNGIILYGYLDAYDSNNSNTGQKSGKVDLSDGKKNVRNDQNSRQKKISFDNHQGIS